MKRLPSLRKRHISLTSTASLSSICSAQAGNSADYQFGNGIARMRHARKEWPKLPNDSTGLEWLTFEAVMAPVHRLLGSRYYSLMTAILPAERHKVLPLFFRYGHKVS